MQVEVVKATIEQKPVLANLLELYAYDFTEFCGFDIGDDGFYGYERLPLYWTEPTRFPYLIYVDKKIAGFILVQKGSPISDDTRVWDISEFFVMKKYKRHGVGTAYRFERIIQDIGDYCEYIFLSDEGGDDRMQCFEHLQPVFLPNGAIERAYDSYTTRKIL